MLYIDFALPLCLETAGAPPSPKRKPLKEIKTKFKTKLVTKSRPAPLEEKPKVPPKPIRTLLSNQGLKSSGGSNLTLKPTVKKPKIKSPAFNSPKRFVIPVKKDDIASGVLRDQKSPAAFKNPIRGDNFLKRKSSLSKDSSARVGIQINARQKTDPSLKANNTTKPTKDVGRKSLATSSIQRDRFPSEQRSNNYQTDVTKRMPSLASQPRTRTVPSKSPALLSLPQVQPSSARLASSASSVSLQSRRKSVGEMMRKSPLTSCKPTPGPGPAGPSSSSHASTLPRIATQQRGSLSQRGSVSSLQSSQSRKESNQVLGLTF